MRSLLLISKWLSSKACASGLVLFVFVALTGCSSVNSMLGGNNAKDAMADIKYSSNPRGVVIDIHASKSLNSVSDAAHALTIAVIQGNNPKAVLKLSTNLEELDRLLSGGAVTDPAILSVDRYVVQPGAIDTIVLARRQEAQVVLLYAGYYNSPIAQRVRMLEVPVSVTESGILVKSYAAVPARMYMSLDLSEVMINDLKLLGSEPVVFLNPDNSTLQGDRPKPDPDSSQVIQL
jgi:predicted component of type VI protein secretion system